MRTVCVIDLLFRLYGDHQSGAQEKTLKNLAQENALIRQEYAELKQAQSKDPVT